MKTAGVPVLLLMASAQVLAAGERTETHQNIKGKGNGPLLI